MTEDQDKSIEEIVNEYIAVHRATIAQDLGPLREWMTEQSAADRVDMTLSAVQREMAVRVYKRCTRSGTPTEQASDKELDSYYCDARLLRELVPPELQNAHKKIESASMNISILETFRTMSYEDLVKLQSE